MLANDWYTLAFYNICYRDDSPSSAVVWSSNFQGDCVDCFVAYLDSQELHQFLWGIYFLG
ncbi:hypothetical protein HU200_013560 [Digitaria exilis]|uniref:Uncharacterized protein n=1 Tax=Digitaria exilis TaxID=1010633 RepID=A0A835KJJ1_9POAL|nr:hypothetical protein HU200_013560 [Digitaria exilis]